MGGKFWAGWIESASRSEIFRLQERRLREEVRWIYRQSPYWHRKFKEAGITPDDINSREDLRRIPFVSKAIMKEEMEARPPYGEFLCAPEEEIAKEPGWLMRTTGTTGKPVEFLYGASDYDHNFEGAARVYWTAGMRPGDRLLQTFGTYSMWAAPWAWHFGALRVGAMVVPTGGTDTNQRVLLIKQCRINTIKATHSYVLHVARVAQEMGLDPTTMGIRRLVLSGEFCSEKKRRAIEETWNTPGGVYETYAAAETVGAVTASCEAQAGQHCFEDEYIIDVIDPKTCEPVGPGEVGELVTTPLFLKTAAYAFHYRTGDLTSYTDEPCTCGRTHRRLNGIFGRIDDMVKIRGVNVFPSTIEGVARGIPELGDDFQIAVERSDEMDTISVQIEARGDVNKSRHSELAQALEGELRSATGLKIPVLVVPFGTLPRYEDKKTKRFIDYRPKS